MRNYKRKRFLYETNGTSYTELEYTGFEEIDLLKSITTDRSMFPPVQDPTVKKAVQKQTPTVIKDDNIKGKTPINKAGPSSSKAIITSSQVSAAVHNANACRAISMENISTNRHVKPVERPGTRSRTILMGSMSKGAFMLELR